MKSILIVINTLQVGGAEKQSVLISNELSKTESVTLVVLNGSIIEVKLFKKISKKVDVRILNNSYLSSIFYILKLVKKKNIKFIFTFLLRSNIIGSIIKIFYFNVKVYGSLRSSKIKKNKYLIELINHKFFHDKTIFNSHTGYENALLKGFLREKCLTIVNCVDHISKNIDTNQSNHLNIISLSRFITIKDYPTALKAVKLLTEKNNCINVKYIIGGYGPEKQSIQKFILENNLEDYVTIVDSPDPKTFFRNGDIYLSTSIVEGTSNSILEAMSYGLPIVTTAAGDSKFIVANEKNGFVCDVGDFFDISEKLNFLINNDAIRYKFGLKSLQIINQNYSQDRLRKDYLNLI